MGMVGGTTLLNPTMRNSLLRHCFNDPRGGLVDGFSFAGTLLLQNVVGNLPIFKKDDLRTPSTLGACHVSLLVRQAD